MSLKRALIAVCFLGVVLGCAKKENTSIEGAPTPRVAEHVRVRLTWLYQASYLPFIVGVEKGFYAERGLDVEVLPSGPDLRPIAPVVAGEDTFGVEGAASIIQAASNGVPIAVIGTFLHRSPEVFMARKSDHLSDVRSWKGKKIGVWIGTHVESLLDAMLSRADLTRSSVEVVPAKFDIAPFLTEGRDRVPIWNAYIYNEAQIPGERGIAVDIITPESVGVQRVGEGIFTSQKFLRDKPATVAAFLSGTAEAIEYTITHQEEALAMLSSGKYGAAFDMVHQANMLRAAAPLMLSPSGKPLVIDPALWAETVKTSFPAGEAKVVDLGVVLHTGFAESISTSGGTGGK